MKVFRDSINRDLYRIRGNDKDFPLVVTFEQLKEIGKEIHDEIHNRDVEEGYHP